MGRPPLSPARKAAWQALSSWLVIGPEKARLGSPKKPFPPVNLSPRDKAYAARLAEGCVKRFGSLEPILRELAEGKHPRPKALLAALLIGSFELLFEEGVRAHAAVYEAVNLARQAAGRGGASFANALLRKIAKNRDANFWVQRKNLAIRFSLPQSFIQKKIQELGQDAAENLFAFFLTPPHLGIRVNPLRSNPEDLMSTLCDQGFACSGGFHPGTLVLPKPSHGAILETKAFQQGFFTIQDSAHVEIVDVLGPKPGERILDLCAAPGTKATAMGEITGDQAEIFCFDLNQNRLAGLRDEAGRLGLTCLKILETKEELKALCKEGLMDRVLVDAPCSNTGVLNRRAEARWHFSQENLKHFVSVQQRLILQAAEALKPGGTLVYSTCSLEPEENEDLARSLDGKKGLRLLSTERILPVLHARDGSGLSVFVKEN